MTILFLGSGPFGVPTLEALAELRPGDLHVATVPDAPRGRSKKAVPTIIKETALARELPCHEVATLKKPHGLELLAQTDARLVITADIRLMLPPSFLAAAELGCFNMHGSLLPKYRGAAPVARGILAGDFVFGVTLYRMVKALDAGPMVGHVSYAPTTKASAPAVEEVLSRKAADLLREWLPHLEAGKAELHEQDESLATFAPRLEKHEGWIDWTRGADTIENQILGLEPWPRTYTEWWCAEDDGNPEATERLFVCRARPVTAVQPLLKPGTVREASATGIDVACGPDGSETLRIEELQRAGKRAMDVSTFLCGCSMQSGDFLGRNTPVEAP